jgi:hypothetical protein
MTFLAEFRCYIGSQTLAPWPTTLAALLTPWATVLEPDAAAQGVRPLTPRRTALSLGNAQGPLLAAPSVPAHGVMFLPRWATAPDVYFYNIFGGPYIFAKSR